LSDFIGEAAFDEIAPLTGTEFGFLVAIDDQKHDSLRITAQPGPYVTADMFAEILSYAGNHGKTVARTLNGLGSGTGSTRGPWQIAIGAAVENATDDVRAYAGVSDLAVSHQLITSLRGHDFWCPPLKDDVVAVVERIRTIGKVIGYARRYGTRMGHMLYFVAPMAPTDDVLDYLGEPFSKTDLELLKQFTVRFPIGDGEEETEFGWGIAIDHDGSLVYVKMEIAAPAYPIQRSDAPHALLATRQAWLENAARECSLTAMLRMVSLRIAVPRPVVTHYYRFTSATEQRLFASGTGRVFYEPDDNNIPYLQESYVVAADIGVTIHRGLAAILGAQRADGAWQDFDIPRIGRSDAWVTAHVGYQLSDVPEEFGSAQQKESLGRAAKFMTSAWRDGWGYNDNSPVDADSTAHGSLFLQRASEEVPENISDVLMRFQRQDGGFSTFTAPLGGADTTSWTVSHPDVTPVVLRALIPYSNRMVVADAVRAGAARLYADRTKDGNWPAFWWNLRWYTAAQWVRTCTAMEFPIPDYCASEALERGVRDALVSGRFLDVAYLLEIAVQAKRLDIARPLAVYLCEHQRSTGIWPHAAALRVTDSSVFEPWTAPFAGPLFADTAGIYSAATILSALTQFYLLTGKN
jgi:hypothetical protein